MNKRMTEGDARGERSKGIPLVLVIILLSAVTLGTGIPVGADEEVTRGIAPITVAPGQEVTVTIEFTTADDFAYIFVQDFVPVGWTATDLNVNQEASGTLLYTEFNETTASVLFLWLPMDSGIQVQAEYTLSVPLDAVSGEYTVTGNLRGYVEDNGSWAASIPAGTIMVEREYGVDLRADEEVKTTNLNDPVTFYITVENLGNNSDTYQLSKITETDFAQLSKTSVSLGVGESEVVELNVSDSSLGSYNTTVSATSAHASNELTVTTIVSEVDDTEPPIVTTPTAEPYVIPVDTDNNPLWGELANLSVVVVDESEVVSVTVDLSAVGGSSEQPMTRIGGSNVWNVSTNAPVGTTGWNGSAYVPHLLPVNATDEYNNSNTSVSIELLVMKNGDVNGEGSLDFADVTYLANHVVGRLGYENMQDTLADVNGDGKVDFADVTYLANHVVGRLGYDTLK
jgi:hypothetical protein